MRRRFLYTILHTFVLFVVLAASSATAQDLSADVRVLLESRDAEIKRLLGRDDAEVSDERRERLRAVINGVIDFRAMSRAALGPHWDDLTGAQRTEFVDVFSAIIRGQSLANLKPYRAPVSYESVTVDGNSARAVTSTVYKDVPMTVEYDLVLHDGQWHVTDIIIDDVSTVGGYARSFQSVIRKKGFDSLMERLREKRAEVEAEG